jgi:DNA-directed RNA polymerase specialized sigma24 family protein
MDRPSTAPAKKSNWVATEGSFAALLEWLDQGLDSKGEAYLEVRRRLVTYFDRKNCLNADDLADETLNRVQRRLEEEGSIETESPAKFCYSVAKYVFLEHLRSGRAKEVSDELVDSAASKHSAETFAAEEETRERERALGCLEKCVTELDAERREMVIGYYYGEQRAKIENRRRLATKFGLTMNALSIRTFRIRERLEACVKRCLKNAK